MVVAKSQIPEKYAADFEAFGGGVDRNGASWVHPLRQRAFARFEEVGMPTARRGNERWKYTNVNSIARATFEHASRVASGNLSLSQVRELAPWDDSWTTITFVDGTYASALSNFPGDSAVEVMSLAKAFSERRELVEKHLARYARIEDDDGFGALNTAFLEDGALIHLKANGKASAPVQALFIASKRAQPSVSYPRVLLVADRLSDGIFVESYFSPTEDEYFTDSVVEMELGEGAALDHYRVMMESGSAHHIGTTRVHQGRDSRLNSISFALGAALGRNDLFVNLDDPGAECTLNGLYMTSGRQHLDNHISLTHSKPYTSSNQLYKGILTDKSRAVFSGQVRVEPDAQKVYANQKDMNLLLSNGAEVDTKPSLLIYADDVKCFDGAAAGEMDEDVLFYMRSRGLDLATATAIMIRAFAQQIIDDIRSETVTAYIEGVIERLLPKYQFQR